MNQLGITSVWLAVQVALVLAPALALQTLAARRGPETGAWVAVWSLGLVVVLSMSAYLLSLPRQHATVTPTIRSAPANPRNSPATLSASTPRPPRESFSKLRLVWARLEHGAAEPAARCRPWGNALAFVALVGTAVGLIHGALGIWAVAVCRRRARAVSDPEMIALLHKLRDCMNVRVAVALRETSELAGPATAGIWRPVILLPDDWRTWNDAERRAVLAHELAHIIRGDYAAGLLARLAVALQFAHPLVRWTAGRLRLQQELAADALGARHAGGRDRYLWALSRLALRQDGPSPRWLARAFLPARGTLIRRITMLRDGSETLPLSRSNRVPTALFLVALTCAVAMLRGPAQGGEDDPGVQKTSTTAPRASATPSYYVRGGMNGFALVRPAALLRRPDAAGLASYLDKEVSAHTEALGKALKVDTAHPDFREFRLEDVEWAAFNLGFDVPTLKNSKDKDGKPLHRMCFGFPTIRMAAPFDWLTFLRQWGFQFEEVREGNHVFYRITGPLQPMMGPHASIYLPDDRTLVGDEEASIRTLLREGEPPLPGYLRGQDWERASRGYLAVALNNENGALARTYDLGRVDDAIVLSLLKGVDHWIFSVANSPLLALDATAACRDDARASIQSTLESLAKLGLATLDQELPADELARPAWQMGKALLTNLRLRQASRSFEAHSTDFGTFAGFAAVLQNQEKVPSQPLKKPSKP